MTDSNLTRPVRWYKQLRATNTMCKTLKSWVFIVSMLFIFFTLGAQDEAATAGSGPLNSYPDLTPAGFLQTHFNADDVSGNPASFSIHRARLGLKGQMSENIRFNFIIGATEPPANAPALVNAFADFTIDPLFNLRAGQFFAPFGLEGPEPITQNPAIERAFSTRNMNPFRMFRDIGLMAYGKHSLFRYSLAIMNGGGANVMESFNPKDIVGRIDIAPVENLKTGVSAHIGSYNTGAFNKLFRQRYGIHAQYQQSPVLARGEIFIRDRKIPVNDRDQSIGGYVLGKYGITEKWEAIGRYDYFSPEGGGDPYLGFTLGPNYQIAPNTQLSLNGILYTPVNDDAMQSSLTIQLQMVL